MTAAASALIAVAALAGIAAMACAALTRAEMQRELERQDRRRRFDAAMARISRGQA